MFTKSKWKFDNCSWAKETVVFLTFWSKVKSKYHFYCTRHFRTHSMQCSIAHVTFDQWGKGQQIWPLFLVPNPTYPSPSTSPPRSPASHHTKEYILVHDSLHHTHTLAHPLTPTTPIHTPRHPTANIQHPTSSFIAHQCWARAPYLAPPVTSANWKRSRWRESKNKMARWQGAKIKWH